MADEFFPGTNREQRPFRADHIPTVAREALNNVGVTGREPFPFESWAAANRFDYPREALAFLCKCESAAEAFLAREVARAPGVFCGPDGEAGVATFENDRLFSVHLQVRALASRIDFVAFLDQPTFRLAVEIDGIGFHHRSADQIRKDYVRERRLVALGYAVIRFTAQEVFATPAECWRQINAIVSSRRTKSA